MFSSKTCLRPTSSLETAASSGPDAKIPQEKSSWLMVVSFCQGQLHRGSGFQESQRFSKRNTSPQTEKDEIQCVPVDDTHCTFEPEFSHRSLPLSAVTNLQKISVVQCCMFAVFSLKNMMLIRLSGVFSLWQTRCLCGSICMEEHRTTQLSSVREKESTHKP